MIIRDFLEVNQMIHTSQRHSASLRGYSMLQFEAVLEVMLLITIFSSHWLLNFRGSQIVSSQCEFLTIFHFGAVRNLSFLIKFF